MMDAANYWEMHYGKVAAELAAERESHAITAANLERLQHRWDNRPVLDDLLVRLADAERIAGLLYMMEDDEAAMVDAYFQWDNYCMTHKIGEWATASSAGVTLRSGDTLTITSTCPTDRGSEIDLTGSAGAVQK
jgi:hypothetical protein